MKREIRGYDENIYIERGERFLSELLQSSLALLDRNIMVSGERDVFLTVTGLLSIGKLYGSCHRKLMAKYSIQRVKI